MKMCLQAVFTLRQAMNEAGLRADCDKRAIDWIGGTARTPIAGPIDVTGNTALHFVTFAPSVEPTRLLISAGANANVLNKRGETPLMQAVRNAQFDLIKLLLAAGAKVEIASKSGETAMSIAQSLRQGGPRPMRPDLTADDFVRLLQNASNPSSR